MNNAGYGLFGTVEELTEQEIRDQMEANFYGALWVTQAALPYLREQCSGHIVQISSTGGVAAWPVLGGYNASKWALEGLSESLAQEVAAFGIKVTLVEPGGYATDWAGASAAHAARMPAYDSAHQALAAFAETIEPGDPAAAGPALLEIVDAENPPLRVFFGTQGNQMLPAIYAERLKIWADWQDLSTQAQGAPQPEPT